jgi:signal transduction histidine kinase
LTLALGYADLLADNARVPPELRVMAEEVRESVQTAALLLERLMHITRLEERDSDLPGGPILDLARSIAKV